MGNPAKPLRSSTMDQTSRRPSPIEPIAIIGMAVRLPGGISSPEQLWDTLMEKRSSRCRVPGDRYNVDAFYSPHPKPGTVCTEYGHFLQTDLKSFDSSLFSMTRAEIEKLDPQARFLLEVTREVFERAGETHWRGQNIGCFVGVFGEDWEELQLKEDQDAGVYRLTGYNEFLLSNRISYEYDLKGPSHTIRTGCSSSLIALHLACQAIRQNECPAAIVGGSNLILSPTTTIAMSEQGLLSVDGRCKTFDSRADGYVRGEAINVLYIKKLDDALKDGNPIQAVIRSTASNCDGKTFGLTQPSSQSHEELMRMAHEISGIQNIHDTAFVECHGTGTPTGDPLETQAVAKVFSERGIYIGSHKPNFGHSEGASGITGVIKTVLALQHKIIPPNINFKNPNPRIPTDMLKIPTEPVAWPKNCAERAYVNSFGLGGANATAIIESASSWGLLQTSTVASRYQTKQRRSQLLVFSASTSESLGQIVGNCRAHIAEKSVELSNLAYTLGARREHLPVRSFCLADRFDCVSPPSPPETSKEAPSLYFVFTGQGAHWVGMGSELLVDFPSVMEDIRSMDDVLLSLPHPPSWSLLFELFQSDKVIQNCNHRTKSAWDAALTQPLCTALQIAIVNLLRTWGIKPEAVVGHSSGEIAAAYAAGSLSLEEAIIVAYYRGLSVAGLSGSGNMLAVGLGREDVTPFLDDGVAIACENSPSSVTLSGKADHLNQVVEKIRETLPDTFMKLLPVDIAYHSPAMAKVGGRYHAAIRGKVKAKCPAVSFYSSVTGGVWDDKEMEAQYWRNNLESPVLFNSAVQSLLQRKSGNPVFVEIGPHSALKSVLREISTLLIPNNIPYCSAQRRDTSGTHTILQCVGELFIRGSPIDFYALSPGTVLSDLPTYAWHRAMEYWSESRLSREWRFRKFPHHDLLGNRVTSGNDYERSWRNILRSEDLPWIRGHRLLSNIVFPGAGYAAMAGEAVHQLTGVPDFTVKEMNISAALVIKESEPVELMTSLSQLRLTDSLYSAWYQFTVYSFSGNSWTRRCFGQVRSGPDGEIALPKAVKYPRSVPSHLWYRACDRAGFQYSHRFRSLANISADTNNRLAAATVNNTREPGESQYQLHPSTIDMCLQLIATAACFGLGRNLKGLKVPVSIGSLYVAPAEGPVNLNATALDTDGRAMMGNVDAVVGGKTVLKLRDVKMTALDDDSQIGGTDPYAAARIHWRPDIDLCDVKDLVRVDWPAQVPYYMRIFDKLAYLCCVEIQNQLASLQPAGNNLNKYRSWLENHASLVATGKYRIKGSEPDMANWSSEKRLSEIERLWEPAFTYPIGVAIKRVFENCQAIFDGTVDPLDLLLEDEVLNRLYDLGSAWLDEEYFGDLGHSKPGLNILEIGAGTGATTARILPQLKSPSGKPLYSEYRYTDISPGFFVHAKERFCNHPNLEYAILDISRDPVAQGFKEGSYDLILAANVFHVTPTLRETVGHAYKLLRPGGRILIEELCPDMKWVNFIMGVLPGWWTGEEDGRRWEPYVSPERWTSILREVGFMQPTIVHDHMKPYQMIARIYARKPLGSQLEPRPVTLLCDEFKQEALNQQFKAALCAAGYQVEIQSLNSTPKPNQDVISLLDLEDPFFDNISEHSFQALIRFLRNLDPNSGLLWCTRTTQIKCTDPRWAQTIGFVRTVRTELGVEMATVEVDRYDDHLTTSAGASTSTTAILKVFEKFREPGYREGYGPEYEWAISEGIIYTARFHWVSVASEYAQQATEVCGHKQLVIGKKGLLDTLAWSCQSRQVVGANQVELDVHVVGMNFRDILVAQGIVPGIIANQIGYECSGMVRQVGTDVTNLAVGDKVITLVPGAYATGLILDSSACVKFPDNLSFEEAATMGCVYSTTIYSLLHLGRLRKGQSILVHSACGGVGLAAIQICQMKGATVLATVGNEDKVNHLVNVYGIPRTHIFNSRNSTFYSDVMTLTSNRGVDLVLNSLSGELLHSSWKCVAPHGAMVEIGKRDILGHARLNMDLFESNRAFFGVDIGQISRDRPDTLREILTECMELYARGSIKPITPIRKFPASEIQNAFRFLQKGNHIGKVVVTMPEKPEALQSLKHREELQFKSDTSYLLVGGLGGLGRTVATWLVERGARNLLFLSRSAGRSIDHEEFFYELQSQGCIVQCFCGSVCNLDDVRRCINEAKYPVAGVVQMSMVVRDKPLVEMNLQDWTAAVEPKVRGTWNLHEATKFRPLDFMLLFSSLCGLVGQPGQANYAAANTFLDAFAQYRQSLGLPASVLDLGPVEDVGVVSRDRQVLANLKATNWHLLSEGEMLDALPLAITGGSLSVSSTRHYVNRNQIAIGLRMTAPRNAANNRCVWRHDFRTCAYGNDAQKDQNSSNNSADEELCQFLRQVESDPATLDDRSSVEFLARSIGVVLYGFLLLPAVDINIKTPMEDLGVDSLVAIELRNWCRQKVGVEVTVLEIVSLSSLENFGELMKSRLVDKLKDNTSSSLGIEGT